MKKIIISLVVLVSLLGWTGITDSRGRGRHHRYHHHYHGYHGGGDAALGALVGVAVGGCVTMAAQQMAEQRRVEAEQRRVEAVRQAERSFGKLTKEAQDDLWRQYQEVKDGSGSAFSSPLTWTEFLNRLNLVP